MKRISAILLLMLIILNAWTQGWRKGEMEIMVPVGNGVETVKIRSLGLDFEPVTHDVSMIRMYLVPEELRLLQNHDIRYTVTIPDLNKHYEHFWDNPLVPNGYYTYEQIIAIADSLDAFFPSICKKVSWGTSLGGRQLAALKISDNVDTDEPEAEIMFDGGIHGDEIGGSQNIIMFARDLCRGYGSNPTITNLVDNREIWLYLMVNPDGRVAMSRYNNNTVDCNRDCGYMWNAEGNSTGAFSQVETKALRNGILDNQFVIYTNYHSGTEIISYPWSYRSDTPRDLVHLNHLANAYSDFSGYPSLDYGQGYNIMYAINGSTKDFQYGSLGNTGWSIEISLDKQPPASQISYYYNANKPAMIEMINRCGWGVSGMVTDSLTGEPLRAIIQADNTFPVYSDPVVGDFHKYLVPGFYTLKVTASGYRSKTIANVFVPAQGTMATNVQMVREPGYNAWKVLSCRIPGNNFGDEGYTPGAIGWSDSVPYSLGKNGWILLDMGDTIYNGPGADFKIIQTPVAAKAFTVSGSNNIDGPFTTIGTGNGTTSFDLSTAPLAKTRYIYVKDNGTGPAFGSGAGFNLDAVEMITPPLIASFIAGNTTPCAGTAVNFTDMSRGDPISWEWSFPGGIPSTSTDQNPAGISYPAPGAYHVTLKVTNAIASVSTTRSGYISVRTLPGVYLGNDTSVCAWNTVLLDAGNPGQAYLWSTGAITQTILADTAGAGYGQHAFWVNVTDSMGCAGSDTILITFENCTGFAEPGNQPVVNIFPNPAGDFFMLDVKGFDGGRWHLVSVTGAAIAGSVIGGLSYKTVVDVREIPRGMYLLKVQKGNSLVVKKIMITHDPVK